MMSKAERPLGIYLHIPFCVRKCRYCDFCSFPAEEEEKKAYAEALKGEIRDRGTGMEPSEKAVDTVFFGGGTPSLLMPEEIHEILDRVRESFSVSPNAEISMEMNPGTVDAARIRGYAEAGINRVSLGVQSFADRELRLLGRIHTAREAEETYLALRETGIGNINLDLMSGLPGQTEEDLMQSVRKAVSLSPDHISLYSLILEEGTPFYSAYAQHPEQLPQEDEEREMLHEAQAVFSENGYRMYEISNFARPGKECRHNLKYWRRSPYLGVGLSAASLIGNRRFANTRDMREYLSGNRIDPASYEELSVRAQMEEYVFLGLRMTEGISDAAFAAQFGVSIDEIYGGILRKHTGSGLLSRSGGKIRLTERGLDLANFVMSDFILDK